MAEVGLILWCSYFLGFKWTKWFLSDRQGGHVSVTCCSSSMLRLLRGWY